MLVYWWGVCVIGQTYFVGWACRSCLFLSFVPLCLCWRTCTYKFRAVHAWWLLLHCRPMTPSQSCRASTTCPPTQAVSPVWRVSSTATAPAAWCTAAVTSSTAAKRRPLTPTPTSPSSTRASKAAWAAPTCRPRASRPARPHTRPNSHRETSRTVITLMEHLFTEKSPFVYWLSYLLMYSRFALGGAHPPVVFHGHRLYPAFHARISALCSSGSQLSARLLFHPTVTFVRFSKLLPDYQFSLLQSCLELYSLFLFFFFSQRFLSCVLSASSHSNILRWQFFTALGPCSFSGALQQFRPETNILQPPHFLGPEI